MMLRPDEKIITSGDFTQDHLTIQKVTCSRELFDVYRIAHDFYASRQVIEAQPDGIWSSAPQFDLISQTTIFIACLEGVIVGSISFTRDGSRGLVADKSFARTCMLIRTEEKPLAEIWRLVVTPSSSIKDVVATSLLKTALKTLADEGFMTCLLSLHPDFITHCQPLVKSVALAGGQGPSHLSPHGVFMRCSLANVSPVVKELSYGSPASYLAGR